MLRMSYISYSFVQTEDIQESLSWLLPWLLSSSCFLYCLYSLSAGSLPEQKQRYGLPQPSSRYQSKVELGYLEQIPISPRFPIGLSIVIISPDTVEPLYLELGYLEQLAISNRFPFHNYNKTWLPLQGNFPDLEKHNNWMSKCLKRDLYTRLSKLTTPAGFTLDRIIQTGVDNPGHPFIMTVGCVAGDEESYTVFSDFFTEIISARHNGYGKDCRHVTDLDHNRLIGADELDPEYVLSCRVRTGRSIRGLALPPFCTRAERREVESIVTGALGSFNGDFEGQCVYLFSFCLFHTLCNLFSYNGPSYLCQQVFVYIPPSLANPAVC